MVEAEVTCECSSIQLPDLQLALTRGMVVYLDATRARQSKDLQRAWRASGVTVKYVQRFREQRPAPLTPPAPQAPVLLPPPSESTWAPPALDDEAIAHRVAALLAPQLQAILEAVQALPRGGVVVHQGQQVAPARTVGTVSGDDAPVFIPSKIGRDDLRPTFEVQATEGTDGGDVSDALEALKAARKPK